MWDLHLPFYGIPCGYLLSVIMDGMLCNYSPCLEVRTSLYWLPRSLNSSTTDSAGIE